MPLEVRRRQTAKKMFINMQEARTFHIIYSHHYNVFRLDILSRVNPFALAQTNLKTLLFLRLWTILNGACQKHFRYSLPQQCLIIYRLRVCIHVNVYSQAVCVLVCARRVCVLASACVGVYAYVMVCMCLCIYVCICVYVYIYVCIYVMCMWMCLCVCIYVCIAISACMCAHICICMCVLVCLIDCIRYFVYLFNHVRNFLPFYI